jgi:predicted phosphodiesterase
MSPELWGVEVGVHRTAITRHLGHADKAIGGESETHGEDGDNYVRFSHTVWGYDDYRDFIRARGQDPDTVTFTWGWTSNPAGGFWNKLNNVRPILEGAGLPKWPLIHPTREPVIIKPMVKTPRATRFKTAVIGADTQIGFDIADDGTMTPYHDDRAIDILLQVMALEQPHQSILAGDIFDLTEQSHWPQEQGFARSTQPSLERGRILAADMRARTRDEVVWIEGNHDKRLTNFMQMNAMASMGLKKAGYPDSYPVMSIPNLIGLDEFDVKYIDAYPAGAWWITEDLRVIHGTKANAAGSTASQYANEMPHISTVFGHTHRQEVQAKTTFDRAGKIKTFNVNPGCLCRVDGTVPSVHGARKLDGSKETYWENWQQGVTVVRYLEDGTAFFEQVQIEEGHAMHLGQELFATPQMALAA